MITVAHLDEQRGFRGGERQASWLVRGLSGLGVSNILVGKPSQPFVSMLPGIETLRRIALPLRGEFDWYSAFRLARITTELGVDIIHAHTSHAHGIAVMAKFLGSPSFLVVSRRVNFMPPRGFLNRYKYNAADRILCVSQTVHDTLRRFGLGPSQLKTVHSAVDPERALMTAVPRATLGIPEKVPFLFSAGSLVEHKDHDNLLQAFALVWNSFPDARLCIAGNGPLMATLKERSASLGIAPAVSFLGHRDDAPGICRSADLYVSSSWSEGLGTSILEALYAGTPVVATEAGGAREMVIPEVTGMLSPSTNPGALAEAILFSLGNHDKALQMAERGKTLAREKFSVERMVASTLDTYRELLSEHRSE